MVNRRKRDKRYMRQVPLDGTGQARPRKESSRLEKLENKGTGHPSEICYPNGLGSTTEVELERDIVRGMNLVRIR